MAKRQKQEQEAVIPAAFRLPEGLLRRLQAFSALTGETQTQAVVNALEAYLEREIRQRKLGRLVEAAVKSRSKGGE